MTYKQLEEANKTIKTTDIKGKDYAEVPQRIKAFRMLYPEGFIRTKLLSNEGGVALMMTEVGYHDTEVGSDRILATGMAYEKEGSTFINKTSYIENCETSSVGRALGMLGIGIDTSVASAEEVQNAILNQGKKASKDKPEGNIKTEEEMSETANQIIDELAFTTIKARLNEVSLQLGKQLDEEALCKQIGCKRLETMTYSQLWQLNQNCDKWMGKK